MIIVDGDLWMGGPAFEDALPKGKRWVLVEDGGEHLARHDVVRRADVVS